MKHRAAGVSRPLVFISPLLLFGGCGFTIVEVRPETIVDERSADGARAGRAGGDKPQNRP